MITMRVTTKQLKLSIRTTLIAFFGLQSFWFSCSNDIDSIDDKNEPPTADFSFEVDGTKTSFKNESVGAVSFSWKFGDGASATEENPTHTYSTNGNYDVELIAINSLGSDSTVKTVSLVTSVSETFGKVWKQSNRQNTFPTGRHFSITNFKGKVWLTGGRKDSGGNGTDILNEVWSSDDGQEWVKIDQINPYYPMYNHRSFVYQNKLWLIGGRNEREFEPNQVWYSEDGSDWKNIGDLDHRNIDGIDSEITRLHYQVVEFQESIIIVEDKKNVLKSSDGENWSVVGQLPIRSVVISKFSLTSFENKLWLLSDVDGLFMSTDGETWEKDFPGVGHITEVSLQEVFNHNDRLYLFESGNRFFQNAFVLDVPNHEGLTKWKLLTKEFPFGETESFYIVNDRAFAVTIPEENETGDITNAIWYSE